MLSDFGIGEDEGIIHDTNAWPRALYQWSRINGLLL